MIRATALAITVLCLSTIQAAGGCESWQAFRDRLEEDKGWSVTTWSEDSAPQIAEFLWNLIGEEPPQVDRLLIAATGEEGALNIKAWGSLDGQICGTGVTLTERQYREIIGLVRQKVL